MNHLEKKILDSIEKYYKRKYTGGITVTKLLSGYKIVLDLDIPDKKVIQISYDCNYEEYFLKKKKKELIARQLCKVQFFRGIVNYPEDDNKRCSNREN